MLVLLLSSSSLDKMTESFQPNKLLDQEAEEIGMYYSDISILLSS